MGDMFRSEEMALCQLFIQPEAGYSSVSLLGEKGIVQFRDLNPDVNAFQRKFVGEVRRCDEMERRLRYIEAEVNKDDIRSPELSEMPKAPNPREMYDLEARLDKTETEILELSSNFANLQANYLELTELKQVLEKATGFFAAMEQDPEAVDEVTATRARLGFVAGVIQRERLPGFERMLWRISRGNVFLRQSDIATALQDPKTGNEIFKTVFVAFYQGEELKSRLMKVCTGFHVNIYPCPTSAPERAEVLQGVKTRLEDLNMVLNQTEDHRHRVLVNVAKELPTWSVMVRKMKAIYHTLNLFNMDVTKKCFIGECWAPTSELQAVNEALIEGGRAGGSSIASFLNVIESLEDPPTYNRTNKFTSGFQTLIDAYGVSAYREVNPALYTIVTFPFLFAIMFGDAGHGVILLLFALVLIWKEKELGKNKIKNEIGAIFFGGRYIVMMMGLFSIYTGALYNDVFSKSFNVFSSSWSVNYNESTLLSNKDLILDPKYESYTGEPYPFGIDPVWQVAAGNKIVILNSMKMKISIIIGVIHMIFGICLQVFNHKYFKNYANIFLEFIPQVMFLMLLFLYLVVMIIMKWFLYDAKSADGIWGTNCAPSVLIYFIDMFLVSTPEVPPGCQVYMYEGQSTVQSIFIVLALLMIPIMLFGKPIYFLMTHKKKKPVVPQNNGDLNPAFELQGSDPEVSDRQLLQNPEGGEGHEEHEEFGEVMIHQAIHTIEYVLSTISHTASYLRLWALSLAHAQLSDVLWSMLFNIGLTMDGYVGAVAIFIIFAIWAALTIAILVIMEGLSAFLHTLRLHWVEFMSKFFAGTGHLFAPFSFKVILDTEEEGDD